MMFRLNWRKIKFYLILLAFLSGAVVSVEEAFQWLRLRSFRMSPPGVVTEDVVWDMVPADALRWWVVFPPAFKEVEESLDRLYPVRASLRVEGFGKIVCSFEPLCPWIVLRWQGKEWYVDEDGVIWLADLPENDLVQGVVRPPGPALSWEDETYSPLVTIAEGQRIFHSRLPIGMLMSWVETLDRIGWLAGMEGWKVKRRGMGRDLEIQLLLAQGRKTKIILEGASVKRWGAISQAVNKIVSELPPLDGIYRVDTTYEDKIIVRRDYQ